MDQTPDNVNGSYSSAGSVIAMDTKNMVALVASIKTVQSFAMKKKAPSHHSVFLVSPPSRGPQPNLLI